MKDGIYLPITPLFKRNNENMKSRFVDLYYYECERCGEEDHTHIPKLEDSDGSPFIPYEITGELVGRWDPRDAYPDNEWLYNTLPNTPVHILCWGWVGTHPLYAQEKTVIYEN